MLPKQGPRMSLNRRDNRTSPGVANNPSHTVLVMQQALPIISSNPNIRTTSTSSKASVKGRNEMESYFERLRALDRLEGQDAFGAKGVDQLCRDLTILPDSFEMYVLIWKIGTTRSGSISRNDWLSAMYAFCVENLMDIKLKMTDWVNETKRSFFMEFYCDLYDYIRGEDARLMPCDTAVKAWSILFSEEPQIGSWIDWYSHVCRQDVTRDVWRQLSVFFASVPDVTKYKVEDKWPVAIDRYVEWCRKPK